jgi:hypothetical protein
MRGIHSSVFRAAMRTTQTTFPPQRDFSSLSVLDLLEAREAHHVQLSSLENVVATAIGRYLIHERDWYATHAPDDPRPTDYPKVGPRTLDNSLVRPWSWPCVLVFVKTWRDAHELGSNIVPRALYMPDGRVVPTCVVLATPDEAAPPPAPGPAQVSPMIGGGYACLRTDQGIPREGSFGCLVYKEGTYYALTSRHVAGEPGSAIRAFISGEYIKVGESVDLGVTKLPLASVFTSFSSLKGNLNFDAGLVRLDDFSRWTSQVFGIGEVGDAFIATEHTLSLDLIGTPVRAFGGATGQMEGEIRALFFQPRSTGSVDCATDVLIGSRRAPTKKHRNVPPPLTRPGDSGTLWFYDPPSTGLPLRPDQVTPESSQDRGARARRLRPIAIQWGGQRFRRMDGTGSAFALGSFLSTVLRQLDIELEHEWSTGHDEYWGKLGHFAIGWKACDLVSGSLGKLIKPNQPRIGFGDEDLGMGKAFKMGADAFVPLADVPDYVWVKAKGSHPNESIQHFADIDINDIDGGKSMLDRCHADPRNCSAKAWKAYFDGFKGAGVGPEEGALPFRVWQIWEAMVAYLEAADLIRFVAAAGILSHYVGDASQPLHCSWLHHGEPPLVTYEGRQYPVPRDSDAFKEYKDTAPAQIHGIYEEGMLEVDAPTMLANVNTKLEGAKASAAGINSGFDAAVATLQLMYDSQKRLSPRSIIELDDPSLGPTARGHALWANKKVRDATTTSLAESVQLLANLWAAAWKKGNGNRIDLSTVPGFSEDEGFSERDLQKIYRTDRKFIPSLSLDAMAASGRFEPPQ